MAKSGESLSRSILMGMVAVSWVSILLLGGAWFANLYFDFEAESQQMRERQLARQKALVKVQVEQALRMVDEIRRHRLEHEWARLKERANMVAALMRAMGNQGRGQLSPGDLLAAIDDGFQDSMPQESLCATVHGSTVYLLDPLPAGVGKAAFARQLEMAVDGVGPGERRLAIGLPDGGRITMLLYIIDAKHPALRVVTGIRLGALEDEIQSRVVAELESIRFGNGGYFFAGTWGGISMLGPAKGRNMWDVVDSDGVKVVQELIRAARHGGGFVSYTMPKLEGQRAVPKVSYVIPLSDWQWYIGAGLSVSDMEPILEASRMRLGREIMQQSFVILAGLLLFGLGAYGLSRRLAQRMKRNILSFAVGWTRLDTDGGDVDPDTIFYDEFKELATVTNRLMHDRRKARKALEESVAQYEALVGNVPGIVYQCAGDPALTIIYMNDNAEDLTGYPASDFVDSQVRTLASIIDPRDAEWVERALDEGVRSQRPFSLEYRIACADGATRWVIERSRPRFDEAGKLLGLAGVIMDISARRESEEEHYNHLHFLETMERVDRGIRRNTDQDTMLSEILDIVRTAFGSDRTWLLHPCDPDAATFTVPVESSSPEFPGAMLRGVPVPLSAELRAMFVRALEVTEPVACDGTSEMGLCISEDIQAEYKIQSQLVAAIYPRSGKPWLIGMHHCREPRVWTKAEIRLFKEISRRISDALSNLLVLDALKQSEERFRTFSEQTLLGICVLQDDVIKFANKAFGDIFGLSVNELIALLPGDFLQFVHPEDRKKVREQATRKQRGDADVVGSYTWRAVTRTGEVRWVQVHSRSIHLDGRYADLISLSMVSDMRVSEEDMERAVEYRTAELERKALELQDANARLVRLDELKSAFLTNVTHDIHTPMTSILGYARLIRKALLQEGGSPVPEANAERVLTNLDIIEREGERLTDLVDGFMDYTAMVTGTAQWDDVPVAVAERLRAATDQIAGTDRAAGGEVVTSISDSLPELVMDAKRFDQMVKHLLENAVRYAGESMIMVKAASKGGRDISITVADMGKGVPAEELEAVFEPFHQVETGDTLENSTKSSGLGLAVVRVIAEHYGGKVWMESRPGMGTSVHVKLPAGARG